jgi:rubrerythrin
VQKSGDLGLIGLEVGEEEGEADFLKKPLPGIRTDVAKREIFETSLEKEKNSRSFYKSIAQRSRLSSVCARFQRLADEEGGHMKLVIDVIER